MRLQAKRLNYILGVDAAKVPAYLRHEIDVENKPAEDAAPTHEDPPSPSAGTPGCGWFQKPS